MSDFWVEMSLPLWQLAWENEDGHKCDDMFYSVFRQGVAYCASCGKTLEYIEGKESYE